MVPRRKQIIDRAAAVVFRQGFGATTVADVLASASVSKGNFYHYFSGKEELGLAIIDALGREYAGTDLDELFSPLKPAMRRLEDFLDLVSATRINDQSADPLGSLASELGATPPYDERIRTAMGALLDRIESVIAEYAIASHVAVNAQALARSALAQIHGLCIQFKVDRDCEAFSAAMAAIPTFITAAVNHALIPASQSSGHARVVSR